MSVLAETDDSITEMMTQELQCFFKWNFGEQWNYIKTDQAVCVLQVGFEDIFTESYILAQMCSLKNDIGLGFWVRSVSTLSMARCMLDRQATQWDKV